MSEQPDSETRAETSWMCHSSVPTVQESLLFWKQSLSRRFSHHYLNVFFVYSICQVHNYFFD
jgi:hypothetical protein